MRRITLLLAGLLLLAGWRDFWTGETYAGGQYVETGVDLATIPFFVRGDATLGLPGI